MIDVHLTDIVIAEILNQDHLTSRAPYDLIDHHHPDRRSDLTKERTSACD